MYYKCNGGSSSETWIEYVFTIEDGPHGLKILSEDGSSWIKEMLIGEISDHIGLDKTAYASLDMEDPRLQNQEVKDQAHDLVYQMVKEEEEAIGQLYNELGIEENIKIDTENDQGEIFIENFDELENNDNTINLDNYHLNSRQNTNFINSIRELLKNMHINMY